MNNSLPDDWNAGMRVRVGLTIYPSQDKAIDQILSELFERLPAQFILLADTSGQLVSMQGERGNHDLVALSALIAGDMAASQEISRLTGQYQNSQLVMREGQKHCSFIGEAGRYLLIFAQVSTDVPLGWARLLIREAGQKIDEIMATDPERLEEMELSFNDEQLNESVDSALDSLFTD